MKTVIFRLIGGAGLLVLSGCMTNGTTELLKAPFDATTDISNGTTNATGDITHGIREFLSSTTPGTTFNGDHAARARQKTEIFAAYSHEHLRSDIARGDGEYLTSLAALAGVPPERQDAFRLEMRRAYTTLFDEALAPRESSARVVNAAWSMGRGHTE